MLRITITDERTERRLIVQGQLINSCASELRTACEKAGSEHQCPYLMTYASSLKR